MSIGSPTTSALRDPSSPVISKRALEGHRPLSAIQPPRRQAFVDTPQLFYTDWPERCGGINAPLGQLDSALRICVVGAGLTGAQIGFEFVKAGADVTILERTHEVGGRTLSKPTADGVNFFERGAMRFPPSEGLTYYYAQEFGFTFIQDFPDPGKVPTLLSFRGKTDLWQEAEHIPDAFKRVHHGWATLVHHGLSKNGKQVLAPLGKIKKLLQSPDPFTRGQVPRLWQEYLTVFKNDTFLSGLMRIFGPEHDWDVPGGEIWTEEIDIPLFGALGQGSGGFKALYGQTWAQLARLEANALEDNQATFARLRDGEVHPAPIQDLARSIVARAQELGLKLNLNTRAINYSPRYNDEVGRYETIITTMHEDDTTSESVYDIVVVCTTTRTMNVGMSSLTDYRDEGSNVLPVKVSAAINSTSMISSSKVFIRTRKFWDGQGPGFPRVILSDTLASQLYTLDYGHPEYGVVLLLYVWGEDADQIQGIKKKEEMLRIVKERVTSVVRRTQWVDYADYLEPVTPDDIDITHWNLHEPALGAFALTRPGQEKGTARTFYSPFEIHNGVYVGGDGVSFNGGWTEGGLMTGMNIVSAVLKKYGELNPRGASEAPVNRLTPDLYIY